MQHKTGLDFSIFTNNFSNGFVSSEFGTLPTEPPVLSLPSAFSLFDKQAENIQLWIKHQDVSPLIQLEQSLSQNNWIDSLDTLNDRELARLSVILASCAHTYTFLLNKDAKDEHRVDTGLPHLFNLWKAVYQKMGKGDNPILSINDAAYYNWRYKNPNTTHSIENLKKLENIQRLVPVFNNNEDDISNLGMLIFEAHFADVIKAIDSIIIAMKDNNHALLAEQLGKIFNVVQGITRLLLQLFNLHQGSKNYIDLEIWSATYMKFVKKSYPNDTNLTGFADSFFYILEAFLGRENYDTRLGKEMQHMEATLSKNIKLLIHTIRQAKIGEFIEKSESSSLKRKFQMISEAYTGDHGFFGVHKSLALSITILGSRTRSTTNGGQKLDTSIGDQLDLSRRERKNTRLEGNLIFQIKQCKILDADNNDSYKVNLELYGNCKDHNPLPFLEAGSCLSIPIKNAKTRVEKIIVQLHKLGIDLGNKLDLNNNQTWMATLNKWPDYAKQSSFTIKQLLYHADLNHLEKALQPDTMADIEKILIPAPERIYSVSGIDKDVVSLLIKRQQYQDGRTGSGSYFLTNEDNIGQIISCQVLPPVRFTLPADNHPILLTASGNGISPFMHYLAQLSHHQFTHPVYLVYFTRADEANWLKEKLTEYKYNLSHLQVCIIHTGTNKRIECLPENVNLTIDIHKEEKCMIINRIINEIKNEIKNSTDFYSYICGGVEFAKTILAIHKKELGNDKFRKMIGDARLASEAFSFTEKNETHHHEDREFSRDEVKQHDHDKSCWVIMNNEVFDITSFLDIHSGGKDIFTSKSLFERDITQVYRIIHQHDATANSWLSSYRIGKLKQEIEPSQCTTNYQDNDSHIPMCPFASQMTTQSHKPSKSSEHAKNQYILFKHPVYRNALSSDAPANQATDKRNAEPCLGSVLRRSN